MLIQHRASRALAVLALSGSVALAGCGASGSSTSAGSAAPAVASAASATAAATPFACPTENTRAFAKTRFVADLGLAAGSFHRYIYKPWQGGKFAQGADGRTLAITKAIATAALDAKLLSNAVENAKASPALCNAAGDSLVKAQQALDELKGKLGVGDLTSIAAIETQIQKAISGSNATGNKIVETSN